MACALHRRGPDRTLLLPFDDRVVPYVPEPGIGSLAAMAALACLLTLAPHTDRPTPPSEHGVHYFFGWSEAVLAHLALVTSGGGQLEQVRSWPLEMDLDGRPSCGYDEEVETT